MNTKQAPFPNCTTFVSYCQILVCGLTLKYYTSSTPCATSVQLHNCISESNTGSILKTYPVKFLTMSGSAEQGFDELPMFYQQGHEDTQYNVLAITLILVSLMESHRPEVKNLRDCHTDKKQMYCC